jgi:hypothetical protein
MRKSILLPLLAAACMGDTVDADYMVVRDFRGRSPSITCEPVDMAGEAPTRVAGATDTSFLVLNAAERRITEYRDDLTVLWTIEYEETGPGAIERPEGVALLGDTAVAVTARGGLRLVVLDRAGGVIRSVPLGFIPNGIAAAPGGDVLVTPMPMGNLPATLLVRFRGGERDELPVPRRPYADMLVGALGNAALVETLPDGSALVVHQFLAPRGFRVDLDGGAVTRVAVPTPDVTADLITNVPRSPISEDQADAILAPAMAMSVDRRSGDVYLLTKSGRTVNGRAERAFLRLDDRLGYTGSFIPDVHIDHMAVLPRRRAIIVADDMDRFYLCPVDADTHTE